ncbi:hypothetical protein [Aneurinibacillus migulanus]|uniref:hypothetical protein n=1 Tax=Aneurinibacillus migulanus TaxID=47500 RepID=UPI001379CC68|nr:hypothetical protein [Aneurinibacillus migulanus]
MNKHVFLEEVCAKCPGSQWGKSAMCRIHDMHIGKVQPPVGRASGGTRGSIPGATCVV